MKLLRANIKKVEYLIRKYEIVIYYSKRIRNKKY